MSRRNIHIPSLYFTKAGSAASWCVSTETELKALTAALAAHAPPPIDEEISSSPSLSEAEDEEDLPAFEPPSDFPASPTSRSSTSSIPPPQGLPRVYHSCTCTCHASSSPEHGHDPSRDARGAAKPPAVTNLNIGSLSVMGSFALVDAPEDDTLFLSPRRAPVPVPVPVPSRTASPSSVLLPSLARSSSSDTRSISTSQTSASLRSWHSRVSSGWWRSSFLSVRTHHGHRSISTSSLTTSLSVDQISKPQPVRPRPRALMLAAQVPMPREGERSYAVRGGFKGWESLPAGSQEILFSPPRLAPPPFVYSAGPASSQIGVAF